MKKIKKLIFVFIAIVLAIMPMLACDSTASYDGISYGNRYSNKLNNGISSITDSIVVTTEDRMIVYYVNMSITVEDKNQSINKIKTKLAELNGYEETTELTKYSYAYLVVRVPNENLKTFISSIEAEGEVDSMSVRSEDITEVYTNAVSKLESLQTYKATLETFYDKAVEIADLIALQKEINEVAEQIDYYTKKTNSYKKQSDYSTVYIYVYQANEVEEITFFGEIAEVFVESLEGLGSLLKWILFIIITLIPYTVFAGVLFGVYALIRFIVCKKKKIPFSLCCKKSFLKNNRVEEKKENINTEN